MSSPRSDARQNLIDALTCATASFKPPHMNLAEVAVCFGGKLMRGNRVQKVNSSIYQVNKNQIITLVMHVQQDLGLTKARSVGAAGYIARREKCALMACMVAQVVC